MTILKTINAASLINALGLEDFSFSRVGVGMNKKVKVVEAAQGGTYVLISHYKLGLALENYGMEQAEFFNGLAENETIYRVWGAQAKRLQAA